MMIIINTMNQAVYFWDKVKALLPPPLCGLSRTIRAEKDGAGVLIPMDKIECNCVGMLGGKYENMHDMSRRVYEPDGIAPTVHCQQGGNTELKIVEMEHGVVYTIDEQNQTVSDNGVVGCQTTDGSSPKHNNRVAYNYKIRKLTERECFRLMGVRDKDFDKIKDNQSKSSLYHLAGDSIVTTCLMAIFGTLIGVDYQSKIKDLERDLDQLL